MPVMDQPEPAASWRVGVDTGGTFTDLLLADPGGLVRCGCKVLSSPEDPGRAVLAGVDRLLARAVELGVVGGVEAEALVSGFRGPVVHGSTVATNALLEAKGDAAALITTAGFEDILRLARQDRPELYALSPEAAVPAVPRGRVIGVDERLAYDGSVITALTQHEIDRVVDALCAMGVAAVAVCLLHSYADGSHERMLAEAIRARLPGCHVTVSSELLPEVREYERASTCVVNAVVGPTMSRYIGRLDGALGAGRLRVMASGGGTLPPGVVSRRPVETVMSGPAGGVLGAWEMARSAGEMRVIGFDMGGTSTDVALCDGGPTRTTQTAINRMPIRLPVIDIHTVGAGGGSIARLDAGGALRVGPESAGAEPGPACYGRQGGGPWLATVTDAHAVLGHLRDGRRLGDALSVDRASAESAVGALAARLGLSVHDTAEGVLRVADAAMARAIQRVSVHRGHDARGFTLVAFGGAGGLHACRLASLLGMRRVLVPVYGGLLSAYGMLAAPARYSYSQAVLHTFEQGEAGYGDPLRAPAVRDAIDRLMERGDRSLAEDGVSAEARRLYVALDLRFAGQSYEITVAAAGDRPVIDRFIDEHRRLYGYAPEGRPIELVAARVEALGPAVALSVKQEKGDSPLKTRKRGQSPFCERAALYADDRLRGPVVIEEYAATAVVPDGWSALVLEDGQLLLEREEAGHG